jgi:hypothetical protein
LRRKGRGVTLSGLAELTFATGDQTYTNTASTIALVAIANLTGSARVLHEPCQKTGCDGDEEQFKGVFARHIQFLYNSGVGIPDTTKLRTRRTLMRSGRMTKPITSWGRVA